MLLISSATYAQKVKYKDIFGLLKTKQYEAAEPFLRKYLKENDDNPNAFLYRGIIAHEKSAKEDILRNTEKTIAQMDTAIYFYTKAYQTITEKELKRNDEYYELYNRRDLRTGEFGVKLSDVQFDIQKKLEGLRERIDRLKMVKHYFVLADSLYRKSNALYLTIQKTYPGEKEFYLRGDDNLLKSLTALALRYDSAVKAGDGATRDHRF
jgi:tetratricopeptide (TPR) repeat protein